MRTLLLIVLCLLSFSARASEDISFLCSWDDNKPITITVDTSKMTASRSDGGKNYKVIKLTKWGVWLMIDEPENVVGNAIQMIQRAEYVNTEGSKEKPGLWIDVILALGDSSAELNNGVSPIAGGQCWEQ